MTSPNLSAPLSPAELSAWREMPEKPSHATTVLLAVLFFISSLVLPFSANEQLSLLFVGAALLFYYFATRSFFAALAIAAPAFLLSSATGSLALGAGYCTLVLGGAAFAFLLFHFGKSKFGLWLWFLPIAAYLLAFLLSFDPLRALLVLLPLPLALVLWLCLSRCVPHTESVVAAAATLALTLALLIFFTALAMGKVNGNLLLSISEGLHARAVALLNEARDLYAQAGVSLGMTDVAIENSAASFVNLAPAFFLMICTVTAYLAWRALLRYLVAFRSLPRVPLRLATLHISVTAAVLFLLTFIASLFSGEEGANVAGTVFRNLYLVLEPGLALMGFGILFAKGSRSCFSMLLVLALFVLLWLNPSTGLTLAAFFGALNILVARFFPSSDSKGEQ